MAFGDSALLAVARRLGRELKPGDTLARIGGDQFGVIVLFDDIEAELERFVASLKGMMASPISFGDREVALTVSIGVVSFDPVLHKKGADLLADAEVALANAKKAGGDCAETFAVRMRATRSDRQSLAHDLRHALDRGQINVMFQPIVRLEDRTVAGFEALPRWRHPRLGLLGPADFYSLADANDALVEIGVFAIETTARELAAWQKALEVTPPIFASINVSARQLLAHDLLSDVRTALNRHYVLRGTLKLELAEIAGDGEPRICAAAPAPRARARRRPGARRFRRRLHFAQPPPALSFRHAEGRSVAGEAQRRRRAAGDPALGDRHGA